MKRTMIFAAAALLLMTAVASAQMGHPGMPGKRGGGPGNGPGMQGPGNCLPGDGPRMMGRGGGHGLLALADEIGLTDDQKEQIKDLMFEHREANIDRQAELKKARLQLHRLQSDDDASEGAVMAAIDKVADLRADIQKANYLHHQKVNAVLTDDQVNKLKDLHQNRGKKMFQGRDGMGRHFQWFGDNGDDGDEG